MTGLHAATRLRLDLEKYPVCVISVVAGKHDVQHGMSARVQVYFAIADARTNAQHMRKYVQFLPAGFHCGGTVIKVLIRLSDR